MIIPKLFINRLIVIKDGHFPYDQRFHEGINIIRGDNGTGKSTIMDLMTYGLGAEITDWTEEQRLCSETLIEVVINNRVLCLKREITDSGKAAMYFYDGNIETAQKDLTNWLLYPNKRSSAKHSYSQQLFELLGFLSIFRFIPQSVSGLFPTFSVVEL